VLRHVSLVCPESSAKSSKSAGRTVLHIIGSSCDICHTQLWPLSRFRVRPGRTLNS
jgi:hypothetical protein